MLGTLLHSRRATGLGLMAAPGVAIMGCPRAGEGDNGARVCFVGILRNKSQNAEKQ